MLLAQVLFFVVADLRPITNGPSAKKHWSFQEFLNTYALYIKERDTVEALTAQLKSFDHNNDGTIDSDELTSALTTIGDVMTEEQVKRLVDGVGTTGRGRISIAALAKFLLAE